MNDYIVNAAPMLKNPGAKDVSTVNVNREPVARPTHLPLIFLYAQKQVDGRHLLSPADAELLYGSETFNLKGKYANHSTVFRNGMATYGQNMMYECITPADAGPAANYTLYLDVLPTKVDIYERNSDGSIKIVAGAPVITGTADGYKVKIVAESLSTVTAAQNFGKATIVPGNQIDTATSTQSQRYPIWSTMASYRGSDGNNAGTRTWPMTSEAGNSIPSKMMAEQRAYPYQFAVVKRANERSSPKATATIYGDLSTLVTFKPNTTDPLTTEELYIGDKLLKQYNNADDPRYAPIYGEFNKLVVYQNNIDALLKLFHAAEVPFINQFYDFSSSVDDMYLFNFLGGTTSGGVPYNTYQFVDDTDSIRLSEYTTVYAAGGFDGTMSDEAFADEVALRMERYIDPNDSVQDVARNVESVIHDSGFPLDTKYKLINLISQRKDVHLTLSPYETGQPAMTQSEEVSAAIALRTRVQNMPESTLHGTPAMRCLIMGCSGLIRNSVFAKRVPATYEIALKSARYMGAASGVWNKTYSFSNGDNANVEFLYDINTIWVAPSVRNRLWDVGLNFILAKDVNTFFFPALKTVYTDDTSIFNGYFNTVIACDLSKVIHRTWAEFSGADDLTDEQLCEQVDNDILNRVAGKYSGRVKIVPQSKITSRNAALGFVWTTPVKMYGNVAKTVMVGYVEGHRASELTNS